MLLLGALSGCGSSKHAAGSTVTTRTSAIPRFSAVLDDDGLKLPTGPTPAGRYRISFVDHRSHRDPKKQATLRFRASGPTFVLLEIPAGSSQVGVLVQNLIAYIAIDGVNRNVPVENPLDVRATPQYPTPAT